jgi:hypothetical protein
MPRSTVDVRLARDSLASLRPPPASIVDGQTPEAVMKVCCLHGGGVSRLTVSLPLDGATARRFAGACRREAALQRKGSPLTVAVAVLGLVPGVVGVVRHDLGLLLLAGLVEICLAIVTLIVRSVLILQRSRHHPVLVGRHHVLIRGVDRETAYAWARLNPGGAVEPRDR